MNAQLVITANTRQGQHCTEVMPLEAAQAMRDTLGGLMTDPPTVESVTVPQFGYTPSTVTFYPGSLIAVEVLPIPPRRTP